jgi:hypothetical protein
MPLATAAERGEIAISMILNSADFEIHSLGVIFIQ